jgi:Heterokaryon incompatibility protein (HET)
MWADAICINQEDISERNAQVRLMGDIYSNASKVATYVGEAPKEDVHVVEALVRKIHAHHVAINAGYSPTKANSNWEIKRVLSG